MRMSVRSGVTTEADKIPREQQGRNCYSWCHEHVHAAYTLFSIGMPGSLSHGQNKVGSKYRSDSSLNSHGCQLQPFNKPSIGTHLVNETQTSC